MSKLHLCLVVNRWTEFSRGTEPKGAINWRFLSLNLHMLNPKCDGVRGWVFRRWLGDEGGVFVNGIHTLLKAMPESFLTPSTMWGNSVKGTITEAEGRSSPDTKLASAKILEFPTSKAWEINVCCLSYPVYGILVMATWADSDKASVQTGQST